MSKIISIGIETHDEQPIRLYTRKISMLTLDDLRYYENELKIYKSCSRNSTMENDKKCV